MAFDSKDLKLEFKPIDLKKDLALAIKFREDSFICSFGNSEKFWQESGPNGEHYGEELQAKQEKDPRSVVHIWKGDQVVGQMEISLFKPDPSIGYINLYYIIPELRGSGISPSLDEYALRYLRSQGISKALLSVSPSNLRAIRYYSRMGWQNKGVRPDAPEVHFMEKIF